MITAIDIENLRGILRGQLEGLAPLTILTGPNGCGKSTVLDALLIGASPDPGHAVGHAVRRRPETRDGARWLLRSHDDAAQISLRVAGSGEPLATALHAVQEANEPANEPDTRVEYPRAIKLRREHGATTIRFNAHNGYKVTEKSQPPNGLYSYVRVIDPGLPVPLLKAFSEATRRGRRMEAYGLLEALIPGFESLDILTEEDGTPALYVTYTGNTGAVPVGLMGDGIQSFIELSLELSALTNGMALIEEPEVYQHPRAIHRTAQVLLVAMRRGIQIVLSTHSLELIDALLAVAADTDLPDLPDLSNMALFNLDLRQGILHSSRYSGADIAFNRETIANDLR